MSVINMPLSIQDELLNYHNDNNYNNSTCSIQPHSIENEEITFKQLYNQIEQLKLNNARLSRANRILKLDCDKIVQEKTIELGQALKSSIEQNIRLQRANRILKDEYEQKINELNDIKRDQILKMKNVGPEYEYLVQVINLLYRQLSGNSTNCKETCCFTEKKSNKVHYCRPEIQGQGENMVNLLQVENNRLKDNMDTLIQERDSLFKLLQDKEYELQVKDDIVKHLESDFIKMEQEVSNLQKDWYGIPPPPSSSADHHSISPELHEFPSVPHKISIVQRPP